MTALLFTCACWLAVEITWAVGLKQSGIRVTLRQAALPPKARNALVVTALLLLCLSLPPIRERCTFNSDPARAAGYPILLTSTAFAIWARTALGSGWSASPPVRTGSPLRTTGPYSIVRHPIYAAVIGMMLGTAVIWGAGPWTAALVGTCMLCASRIGAEERQLRDTFGETYEQYAARVPRLVPLIHVRTRASRHARSHNQR